jgi:hypothetical protein
MVEYLTRLPQNASLEELSSQLRAGKGIETVSWSHPKRL